MKSKAEILQSLRELSEKGSVNERKNAKKILEKLMSKYDIDNDTLDKESIHTFYVKYSNAYEKKLATQVFYSVCGNLNKEKYSFHYKNQRDKKVYFYCTDSEYAEIIARYEFYKYHLNEDLEIFYTAFIATNDIYPPSDIAEQSTHYFLTEKEQKALELSRHMDKHEYLLQLECKVEKI